MGVTPCRPNVLALNYLLGSEFFMADQRRQELQEKMPEIDCGSTLDAILYTSCTGVDEFLSKFTISASNDIHPLVVWGKHQGIIRNN